MKKLPVKVALTREDIAKMPDPIFKYLVDAMVEKAKQEGYDVPNDPNLVFGNWKIKCEIVNTKD
jgi:hypothetical protein